MARSARRPREAFFSRAEKDRPEIQASIQRIEQVLARHRVKVWTAPSKVRGAELWHDEIGVALRRCDWFLVALSRRSVTRPWVKREVLYALQQKHYANRILPLIVEDCDVDALSWTLSNFQMIDFRTDFEAGCRALLRTWGVRFVRE